MSGCQDNNIKVPFKTNDILFEQIVNDKKIVFYKNTSPYGNKVIGAALYTLNKNKWEFDESEEMGFSDEEISWNQLSDSDFNVFFGTINNHNVEKIKIIGEHNEESNASIKKMNYGKVWFVTALKSVKSIIALSNNDEVIYLKEF
jgi:hypothetical protein